MQYTSLGRSGLQVRRLACGTMNCGELTDQTAAFQILDYIGSSNFAGWDIATAQSVAASRHFLGLASEQSLYNLSARTIELEVIPALRYYGIGLIPWSPIGMGLLGGVLRKAREGRRAMSLLQMRIEQ